MSAEKIVKLHELTHLIMRDAQTLSNHPVSIVKNDKRTNIDYITNSNDINDYDWALIVIATTLVRLDRGEQMKELIEVIEEAKEEAEKEGEIT